MNTLHLNHAETLLQGNHLQEAHFVLNMCCSLLLQSEIPDLYTFACYNFATQYQKTA